jgi:hypothetical protein
MPKDKTLNSGRPLPPEKHRWKKGTSGNPRGRPTKEASLTNLLRDEIQNVCPADREQRTWKELVVRATLQLAMKGNAAALKEVWERLDGKVLQTERLELGEGGKQVTIQVVYGDQQSTETKSITEGGV